MTDSFNGTIFIDFDGVVRHWTEDDIHACEADLKVPTGTLFQTAFDQTRLHPAITGAVCHEAWEASVKQCLADDFSNMVAEGLIQAWQKADYTIDFDLLADIQALAPQAKLVLATNATTKLADDLKQSNLMSAFDVVVNSSDIALAKPERGFFEKALSMTDSTAETSVFIDDNERNVQTAANIGFSAVCYQNKQQVLRFIENLL